MVILTAVVSNEKAESKIVKKTHERIIKNFMDILVMAELRKAPLSGYDVIAYIHNKYNILVSSGTIYSLMYSLERNGLVMGAWQEKKRTYKLTDKGKKTIEAILSAEGRIKIFVANVLCV
jgi:DNA-binding PadR family transcriptional regulator